MMVNLTLNNSIKIFDDVACHVELEDEWLGAIKISGQAYVATTNSGGALSSKYNKKKWKKMERKRKLDQDPRRTKRRGSKRKGALIRRTKQQWNVIAMAKWIILLINAPNKTRLRSHWLCS